MIRHSIHTGPLAVCVAVLGIIGQQRLNAQPPAPIRLEATPQGFRTFYGLDDARVPRELMSERFKPLPVGSLTCSAVTPEGVVWLGTREGLMSIDSRAKARDRVRYFAGKRWLPDDEVHAVHPEGQSIWVRTKTGVAHIEARQMTLAQKAALFEERIRLRHDRHGMVADSVFDVAGDPASNRTFSNDNDGLWTAMYGAAECFRYAATRSPESLERARRSVEALLFLEQVTGRPGFPARSYIRSGEPKPKDGFWYKTADGAIEWKADTSSDEIVGHFYLFAIASDLLPAGPQKRRIRDTAERIMAHIAANGYHLVDVTGKPTRWGRWSPEYFKTAEGRPDSPLNALELLMFLKVTHHLTGDARWETEYRRAALTMGYAELTTRQLELVEELNYSDEELAMLSFYPLFLYEKDPKLLAIYRKAMEQWWKNEQRELNPLWTFIYQHANPRAKTDLEGAVWTLERIPTDLIKWDVRNSQRADVEWESSNDRHRRRQARTLLPADERPVMKWNGNPFVVDGGAGGRGEDDGAFFLLPYWMGRYHGYLLGE